jgi:iron complex transport system substrate-binding protein
MNMLSQSKRKFVVISALCLALLVAACAPVATSSAAVSSDASSLASSSPAISFVDDDGRQITLNAPCRRIISLYSAHTENLYALGAGQWLIGAHSTSTYPAEAAALPRFDYNGDPETLIAAEPDLVLIRPNIARKAPDFISALEKAGVLVVSLYPDSFEAFDGYISHLAMLTGTEAQAETQLARFHEALAEMGRLTETVSPHRNVFFESTENNLRTVTPDSMPGIAIRTAGGENVAKDAVAVEAGSSIASFGVEKVLALADEIDVYVAQKGAMNASISAQSSAPRPGFSTIKAVREGHILIIDEKLISSPTFRFYEGVREMAECFYPELIGKMPSF